MNDRYDVFIGNLPTTVSTERLRDLFSQAGKINHIWINRSFEKITYGFIGFANLFTAEKACNEFNGSKLDCQTINVRLSDRTNDNLKCKIKPNGSLLLELPKIKKMSKETLIKTHLAKDLRQNKEIGNDFVKACFEAEKIKLPNQFEIVKNLPEQPSLTALETTITRYFKQPAKKELKADFDLSKGKLLTNEQYDKFFNVQLTKQQPVKQEQKKKRPYSLDYRCVNDMFL